MVLDKPDGLPDDARVKIASAIRSELGGRSQQWLADAIGVDKSQVTRLLQGHMEKLTVDRVVAIERALDLQPGHLLRAAGLVHQANTVRELLEGDPDLDPVRRGMMVAIYDTLVRESRKTTPRAPSKASKATSRR